MQGGRLFWFPTLLLFTIGFVEVSSFKNSIKPFTTAGMSASMVTPLAGGDVPVSRRSKFGCIKSTLKQLFFVSYEPHPEDVSFLERAQSQDKENVNVKVAVLSAPESKRYFGTALSRRGIQPVYVEVKNHNNGPLFFDCAHLDPNYYPPLEAALLSHFLNLKQLVASFGVLAFLFFPLVFILPSKLISAGRANKRMNNFFWSQQFPRGFISEGETAKGFVFCSLEEGTKIVNIQLFGQGKVHEFAFSVPVPGLAIDYQAKADLATLHGPEEQIQCNLGELKKQLENQPRATTNAKGTREGDPANLVVIGDFETILTAFGPRWDETEVISLDTCIKTAKSFCFGSPYKSSPVSALYMFGRSQGFALQRARGTISERLHLRLWMTPMRFEGKPVWLGQISRDIGVKLAKTWNLTTHKVDPNVDEARDYVMSNMLESGYLDRFGLVGGVGISTEDSPRKNLGNDPFVTDGKRAVIILSPQKTDAKVLTWE